MEIRWTDESNEDDGEQYRFLIPDVVLADLWHAQYEEWGKSVDRWRLNLAGKETPESEMVTEDHDLEELADEEAAKAWAEPLIARFMKKTRAA